MSFSTDITRFVQKTGVRATTVVKKLGVDTYRDVLVRSPVLTGRYRGSHRISVNRVDTSFLSGVGPRDVAAHGQPPTGFEIATALQRLADFRFGDTIHISNNLPYALPLERGHSRQAPAGVYALAFLIMVANFAATVNSVVRGGG